MERNFKLKIVIIIIFFFGAHDSLLSCSCTGEAYFCQEISDTTDSFLHPHYVLQGIKLKDTLHGMFLKIEYQYINEIFEDTILIWGDPGNLCRVYTSIFGIGDTIILGINRLEFASGMPQEAIGDFWLPACGITYLEIENGVVLGPISMDINAMPLEEFDVYMENEGYKNDCMVTSTAQLNPFEFKIYPNPASHTAYIGCENCDELELVSVYNAIGEAMKIRFAKEEKGIRLYIEDLEKGLYFVQLKSRNTFISYKFLVK